jgi:hypothetical protein
MVLAGGSGCGAAGGSMPMGLEPSSGACSEWRAREVEATPRRRWIGEWEEYNAGGMVGFLGGRLGGRDPRKREPMGTKMRSWILLW